MPATLWHLSLFLEAIAYAFTLSLSLSFSPLKVHLHSQGGLASLSPRALTTSCACHWLHSLTLSSLSLSLFQLALIQTKHVVGRLQKLYPKQKFEIRKWKFSSINIYTFHARSENSCDRHAEMIVVVTITVINVCFTVTHEYFKWGGGQNRLILIHNVWNRANSDEYCKCLDPCYICLIIFSLVFA